MAYPYVNSMNSAGMIGPTLSTGSPVGILPGGYPIFQVSSPVDVTGLEFAVAGQHAAGTALLAAQGTGAESVLMQPYDGTTTASGITGNNPLIGSATAATAAGSNAIGNIYTGTNSWTGKHAARKAVGSSTTDLDADDWVNLDVQASISGADGFNSFVWTSYFVHGIPGAVQ